MTCRQSVAEMVNSSAMKLSILAIVLLFGSLRAHAAPIDRTLSICYSYATEPARVPSPAPKCAVRGTTMYIDGAIYPDDLLFEIRDMYPEVTRLELNSHGGPVINLFHLTDLIRARGIHTHVRAGAVCSSACTALYMAGTRRTAHVSARFMFHGVNRGGRPIDRKTACAKMTSEECELHVQGLIEDQLKSTRELFAKYVEYGARPEIWTDYLKFPMDELWWEHGNFLKKVDWNMSLEEAVRYQVVEEITD